VNWFVRYQQEFHKVPQPYARMGSKAINVALDATTRVGTKDRTAVRDAILATHDYSSMPGTDEQRSDAMRAVVMEQSNLTAVSWHQLTKGQCLASL
jgi:hypothetical protein